VAFRYVLNLEASRMDSRVPFDRFKYVATCGLAVGGPTLSLRITVYCLPVTARTKRRTYGSIRNVCIWIRKNVQNVKLYSLRLGLRFHRVCETKNKSLLPRLTFPRLMALLGSLSLWKHTWLIKRDDCMYLCVTNLPRVMAKPLLSWDIDTAV
jgi:hypothetical protein